jgi:hypothetical protein
MRIPIAWRATALAAWAAVIAAATPTCAQNQVPEPIPSLTLRGGESVSLDGGGADMAFAGGEEVRVGARTTDDIFAAGRQVRIEGAGADHVFAAGGEIDLNAVAAHDVIVAGGRIALRSGAVADDVVAAGGDIRLEPAARVGGSAVLTGGRLRIGSPVAHQLRASGGRIELDSAVGGDVWLKGETLVVGPNARIGGNLHLRGETIQVSPQAIVRGETFRVAVPGRKPGFGGAVLALLFAVGVMLLPGIIAAAAPPVVAGAERRLRGGFWPAAGAGALVIFLGPIALLALLFTVVGVPLALFLGGLYVLAAVAAFAAVSYWIGQILRRRFSKDPGAQPSWSARLGWTVLAAFLLMVVCAIPVLGGLAWLLALAAGVGALILEALGAFRRPTSPTP